LVFDDVFFHLTSGQALCVRGANGSGKSSLLRQLAGLLPLAAGALTRPDPHKYTHYLGHADGLKAALSIGETLAYEAALAGQGADRAADLTARLGLAGRDWQYVGDLSAGQKRRLTLARLLLDPRPLWLLDEPMTALDEDGRALVGALAKAHLASGGMIIAASHEPLGFANAELVLGAQI
jgi:heme exporter protein A